MKGDRLYDNFRIDQEGQMTGYDFVIKQAYDPNTMISAFWKGGSTENWRNKEDETGQLFLVYVAEEKRKQGIGYMLILLAIKYMYSKGANYFTTNPNEQSFSILNRLMNSGLVSLIYDPKKMKRSYVFQILPEIENSLPGSNIKNRSKPNTAKVLGKEITLSMPNGEKRRAQFAIVELDDVLASHDEKTFASSEGYPTNAQGQNINDRNYSDDKLAQERVRDNAKNFDPFRLLTTSRTPSGSPIVAYKDDKMIVVSGNNRTMSTKIASQQYPEKYQQYVDALCEEIEAFGFSRTDKSERLDCQDGKLIYLPTGDDFGINNDTYKFEKPFLVRIDYDFPAFETRELAKYNQSTMKGKRAVDKTIERSNSLRENPLCKTRIPNIIDEYERMSEFFADRISQKTMLEALLQCNLITEQSIPEYYDDGYFTNAGKELVESVLAGIILDKEALKAAERDGIKQARRVVVYAMPVLIENSTFDGEANLVQHVNDAILYINEVKSSGLPFDQYINQGAMFEQRKFHPWAIYLSRLMQLGQRKFKAAIKSFNSSIKQSAGAALFADQAVSPKEAFIAYVVDQLPESEQRLISQFAGEKAIEREPWLFIGDYVDHILLADRTHRKVNGEYRKLFEISKTTGKIQQYHFPKENECKRKVNYALKVAKEIREQDGLPIPESEITKKSTSKIRLLKAKKAKKLKLLQLW